jgi:hypothetical protein
LVQKKKKVPNSSVGAGGKGPPDESRQRLRSYKSGQDRYTYLEEPYADRRGLAGPLRRPWRKEEACLHQQPPRPGP